MARPSVIYHWQAVSKRLLEIGKRFPKAFPLSFNAFQGGTVKVEGCNKEFIGKVLLSLALRTNREKLSKTLMAASNSSADAGKQVCMPPDGPFRTGCSQVVKIARSFKIG